MGKGKVENLIPNKQRTPDELRQQTRKGGIRSGEVRREKANVLKVLRMLLADAVDVDGLEMTRAEKLGLLMMEKAEGGDLAFIKEVLDRAYGKPAQTVDMQSSDGSMSPAVLTPVSFDQWKKDQDE